MDARLQRRIQRYGWDRAADCYDAGWADALRPARERLFAHADLRVGERVLDEACGTGAIAITAAQRVGPSGSVLARDLSEEMVTRCRAAAEAAGLANVRVERGDAEEPMRPAASGGGLDAALCALGLMYMPDPEQALLAMAGALRPGGRIVVAVWGERSRCGWADVFPIVDARVRSEVCPLFFRLGSGDALHLALQGCGIAVPRIERVTATMRYPTLALACEAALYAGPVALALSRLDPEGRAAVAAEYAASIRDFRDGDGDSYAIPGEFVVGSGARVVSS
jgi:ubiquinone/menaquinone biosynthesis C-methylase UbiE